MALVVCAMLAGAWWAPAAVQAAAPAQAAPAPLPTVPAEDLNRIRSAGAIVVGTSANYPPFQFYNSNFQLDGFDIKLMEEIAAELGVKVEFKTFAFAGLLDALRLGQVDAVISALSVTPERQQVVDFSNIYYVGDDAVLVRAAAGLHLTDAAAFANHTVAVEAGSTYQSWVQQTLVDTGIIPQTSLLVYDNIADAVNAVRAGDVDGALLGLSAAQSFDTRYTELTVGGRSFNPQQLAIAVRKGSNLTEPINRALFNLQADGRFAQLVQAYLQNSEATPTGDTGLIPLPPPATPVPTATAPVAPTATAPAAQTPAATAAAATGTPAPATTPTPAPPTATATLAPPSPTPTATPCVYGASFAADLTFDDKNMTAPPVLIPGLSFSKSWRLLNSGSCPWLPDFALFYVNGNRPEALMSGRPVPVGHTVQPGETVDLTAELVAPSVYGTFQGFWQMRTNQGAFFGETVWVGISVPDPNPPTPTPVPPPPPTPTAPPPTVPPATGWTGNPSLRADNQWLQAGQCTNVRWDVDGVNAVFFVIGGQMLGKGGHDFHTVCPPSTETYELRVVTLDGQTQSFFITVNVTGAPQASINFWADRTEINRGECTTLRWDVQGVREVFYQGNGVAGQGSNQECPGSDRTYRLDVVLTDGSSQRREVFVRVIQRDEGPQWRPDE